MKGYGAITDIVHSFLTSALDGDQGSRSSSGRTTRVYTQVPIEEDTVTSPEPVRRF